MAYKVIAEFKQRVADLPETEKTPFVADAWIEHSKNLRQEMVTHDLDDFLNWPTVKATMFVGETEYVTNAFNAIQNSRYATSLNWALQAEKDYGNPDKSELYGCSGNQVLQAAHLLEWWNAVKFRTWANMRSVVEIGGGYGLMARTIYSTGYGGEYYLYDLPEASLLQEAYLVRHTPLCSGARPYPIVAGRFTPLPQEADLLIGIASLSEMPPEMRKALMGMVNFKHVLILFQDKFYDVDNTRFFGDMTKKHGGVIVPSPYLSTHYYWVK